MDASAWAQIAAAVFTAIAAMAALSTARQGRRTIEAAERPELDVQVLRSSTGNLELVIINTGRGTARGSTYFLHGLGSATEGVLGDGYVLPGQRVRVISDIGPVPSGGVRGDIPNLAAIAFYRDAEGYAHVRTHDGREKILKTRFRRRPAYPEHRESIMELFPKIGDPQKAHRANSKLLSGTPGP